MAILIKDFHSSMRIMLGDQSKGGIYRYSDESLSGAIISLVLMGQAPKCIGLSDDRLSLDPEPPTPDSFGYIVTKAVKSMLIGQIPGTLKTRGFGVSMSAAGKRDVMAEINQMLYDLETNGDLCGEGAEGDGVYGHTADFVTQINLICE